MKVTILLMGLIIVSASYTVYSFYQLLVGQPIQPELTGLATGVLFTASYYVTTKQFPMWTHEEDS